MEIVTFDNQQHREQVVSLWREVFGYESVHNSPEVTIEKKNIAGDGLFFVAITEKLVIGTVMAGYDGHRGWIYSLAVHSRYRKQGIGTALLTFAEERLAKLGCMKVNLQIMDGNEQVQQFYEANGYAVEKRISMGKKITEI